MLTTNYSTLLQDGVAAAKKGDKANARTLLLKATQLRPNSEIAWFWLSYIATTPHDAALYLRRVLEINPKQERAKLDLKKALLCEGIALAKAGDKPQARSLLQEVLELDSNNEHAWLWLAWVAEDMQDLVFYLERVITINPANEYAHSWLEKVRVHIAKSKPTWQCPLCTTTGFTKFDRCPDCGVILTLDDIDSLLTNQSVNGSVINQYVNQHEKESWQQQDFTLHYHLALCYFNTKEVMQGIKHLRVANQLQPDDRVLQSCLEQLLLRYKEEKEEKEEKSYIGVVLVVDDSPTVRKLVSVTLERQGYQVITASDGMQALAKLNEVVPGLILLDITMPNMDGYQVCKFIKSNAITKHVPVLMLSGKDGFFDKIRGRMAGSTEYLTKPFDPDVLLRAVQKHYKQN